MKNLLILFLFLNGTVSQAQVNEEQLQLDYLLSPIETELVFDFGSGLDDKTRFRIDYYQILGYPFRLDTTIAKGVESFTFKIPVDHPVNLRIRIKDQLDQVFLIPGYKIYAEYNPEVDDLNKIKVIAPKQAVTLDQYYHELFDLLGISSQRISAYRSYQGLMDINEKFAAYDSLAFIQHQFLADYTDRLPEWFVNYEWKSIKYLTKLFSASAITDQNYLKEKSTLEYLPLSLLDTDINDSLAVLTSHYLWYLRDYALLTLCGDECYKDDKLALPVRFLNVLQFSNEITNPDIRQALIMHTLRSIYLSSQPFPDSLIEAYEAQLSPSCLEFINQYKKPSIAGHDAPSFYLSNPEGESFTLKDLKGQVILLNFWFVGCKPCEIELPHEKELVEELADADFKLVNICTNTPEEIWKEYVREADMPGLNLYAKGNWHKKLANSYQFSSYPTYVLIGKDGKVIMDKAPRPSGDRLLGLIKSEL